MKEMVLHLIQQKFLAIMVGEGRNNFLIEWVADQESTEVIAPDGEQPATDVDTSTELGIPEA